MKTILKKAISGVLALALMLSVCVCASAANDLSLTWPGSSWNEGTPPDWALNATQEEIDATIEAINTEYKNQLESGYDLGTAPNGLGGWGDVVGLQFIGGNNVGNPWGDSRKWGMIVSPFAGTAFSIKGVMASKISMGFDNGAPLSNEIVWNNPDGTGAYTYQVFDNGEIVISADGKNVLNWGYTVGSTVDGNAVEAMKKAYSQSAWNGTNLGCTHSNASITEEGIVYQEFFGNDSNGRSAQINRGLDKRYGISYVVAKSVNATEAYVVTGRMMTSWASTWQNLDTDNPDRFVVTGAPISNQYRSAGTIRQDFENCTMVLNTDDLQNPTLLERDNSITDFAVENARVFVYGDEIGIFTEDENADLTAIVPTFTIADTATVDKASGVAQDFTSPVTYTVTAENGNQRTYTVIAEQGDGYSDADRETIEALYKAYGLILKPYTINNREEFDKVMEMFEATTLRQKAFMDSELFKKLEEAEATISYYENRPRRVVFVGDSITAPSNGYVAKVANMFDKSEFSMMNAGVSGFCLSPASDNPYTSHGNYTSSLAYQPNIVFIMLGTNDSKPRNWNDRNVAARFKQDLIDMVNAYRAIESEPTVVIATSPTVYMDKGLIDTINDETVTLIAAIQKEVAEELGCPLLDINAITKNQDSWFNANDGVHPNDDGHTGMANAFAGMIEDLEVSTAESIVFNGQAVEGFSPDKHDYTIRVDELMNRNDFSFDMVSVDTSNEYSFYTLAVRLIKDKETEDVYISELAIKVFGTTGYYGTAYRIKLTTETAMLGDLNEDQTVNVSDVVLLRQIIMNDNADANQLAAGDMNGDGTLNVSDVVALRQLIMNVE